jgi:lipoprotein-anchoring transpeptidase ErfK/SrfK
MPHTKRGGRALIAILAGAALAVSAACSAGPVDGQAVVAADAAPLATVTASPALGDTALSPVEPVSISVSRGSISSLTVTSPTGAQVAGTMSTDKTSWTLAEPLGYGKTYTVSGEAVGTDGKSVPITGEYTTVTPTNKITSQVSPGDGAVVGVAAPVIVKFGAEPVDRALAEQHVTITTTPKVEGTWAWITHDGDTWPSLDWRPKDYWPAGTTVHVESDLYGLDFGGGTFGGDNVTTDFTIGRNQVVLADANSHTMVVQQNGVTVATYDASYGSGDIIGDPNRVTRSGIHIVMDKEETTTMSNPAYGYTDVTEHWAVRISDNGEFIHQNQETVGAQGVDNVSHGCINLSAENAQAYFQTAIYGDPVEVTGTSVQLSPADGDIYDWAIPWSEWTTLASN